MEDVVVRLLGEDDWEEYRALRLAGLQESPAAFVDTYADEVAHDEKRWRTRMRRASRFLAERDGFPLGIASLAAAGDDPTIADVFALWIEPHYRQAGVAWQLMEAAARLAATEHRTHLHYWVGEENTRAIAFAVNFGFRMSPYRRPARVPRAGFGELEIAMVLPIGADPAAVPNPTLASFGSQYGPGN